MTTRVELRLLRSISAASVPFISGIAWSMTTMSGFV